MIKYENKLATIVITTVLLGILLTPLKISCQNKIQERMILEKNQSFVLKEDSNSKFLLINRKDEQINQEELFYSPIYNSRILESNPIPWYIRNQILYYIPYDNTFKGSYSLTINVIDINEVEKVTSYDLRAITLSRSNPLNQFYVSELHNRKFNKEDFKNLYYDFTVRKSEKIVLISYFENKICAYESLTNERKLELCSCEVVKLAPPFQIFEDKQQLFILDSKGDLSNLTIHQSGKISFDMVEIRKSYSPEDPLLIKND